MRSCQTHTHSGKPPRPQARSPDSPRATRDPKHAPGGQSSFDDEEKERHLK